MLIVNIGQLVTPLGDEARGGGAMGQLTIVEDAYVKITKGKIVSVGPMAELSGSGRLREELYDARRGLVLPGFVDPHTHAAFVGTREDEFLARCLGEPYGKGILTSMKRVRAASEEEIYHTSRRYLEGMLRRGTTTVEIKSGYGLDTESELKLLRVIRRLGRELPQEVVPTFLGAHAVPEDIKKSEYIEEIITRMIPEVRRRRLAEFCDVFCEKGFYSRAESREILRAAQGAGLKLKIHAEELSNTRGAELAAELGAVSADHLLHISPRGIQKMKEAGVVAVLLPGTAFTLGEPYAPAREMIDAGLPVALGTDFNPGTCLIPSMPHVISLAVLKMRMTAEEAITAATLNAAAAVGRAAETGTLEEGKRADLVVFDLENYRQLPYFLGHDPDRVRAVFCQGRLAYENPHLCAAA